MNIKINNNKLYLEIDSLGAQLISIKDLHGTEYIWQGDERYWRGHSPLLFPIVGALRNNEAIINGTKYTMPRHGIARISEFKLVSSLTDSAIFRLSSNEETRKSFPFDFQLNVTYELSDNSLSVVFEVINNDEKPMPYTIGAHPGFILPIEENEKLSEYILKFPFSENCDSPTLDPETSLINETKRMQVLNNKEYIKLCPQMFYNDAIILENLKSRSVDLYSVESGRGIRVDFDGFNYLGIWQAKDAPFLCIEPWTGTATTNSESDVFEEKRGMKILKSGESEKLSYKITVL